MSEKSQKTCENCNKKQYKSPSNFDFLKKIDEELDKLPPYTKHITRAMIILGDAVTAVTNLKDKPVLDEMKKVINDLFKQAEDIIMGKTEKVH